MEVTVFFFFKTRARSNREGSDDKVIWPRLLIPNFCYRGSNAPDRQ